MPALDYLAFDLEIGPGDGQFYPVAVLSSPAGEARAEMELPIPFEDLRDWLFELDIVLFGNLEGVVVPRLDWSFGSLLFNALFAGDIRTRYDISRQMAREKGAGLRIKLRINDPELAILPWELLYDARTDEFLALSRHTPVVRYLEVGRPAQTLQVRPPLRVLSMVSSPRDLEPLDVEAERARMEQALAPLVEQGKVELVWLEEPTWRALQEAMQAGPWHIFHFIGHATDDEEEFFAEGNESEEFIGALILTDDDGNATPLGASDLARLLADEQTLRLVILNACEGARGDESGLFTSMAAALVERGLPAVLAMQYAISDEAAIEFSRSFYGALANGYPIDAATGEARKAISLALPDSLEWVTPVLFMRAPDGMLWTVAKKNARRPLLWIMMLLLLLLILGFVAYPPLKAALTPEPPPAPMTGKFNIAVARFGQVDEQGRVQPSEQGALLSQWVSGKLKDEFDANPTLFGGDDVVETLLVPDSFSDDPVADGMVKGDTPAEREANAAALAQALNAHMLIYGNLVPTEGGEGQRLALEFYISPFLGGEARELAGNHALGDPAPVNLSGGGGNPLENIAASSPLETRTAALVGLTTGLIFDLVGDHEQALETLSRLEEALPGWRDEDGKELLYFMLARQRLFLDQLDEAEVAADEALAIDPDYVRANIVLGSVFAKRAVNQMKESQQPERENVAQAVAAYEAAVQAAAGESSFVGQIARMSLALGYLLQAQSASLAEESEAAIQALDRGLAELEPVFDPLEQDGQFRYLAQAYQYQGNAYFLKADVLGRSGDREGRRENLSAAREAYTACVEQGDRAPTDETLQRKIIDAYCRPMLTTTDEELSKLEE